MTVVASYAALLDGGCQSLILQDPPDSQDRESDPDGRGEAIEVLNCLKKTDIWQLPALLHPAKVYMVGSPSETFGWSENILNSVTEESTFHVIQSISDF
jgi:hypothetical protein